MRRPVFLSFCYDDDVFRVQEIKKMGLFEGQPLLSTNEFEKIKRNGSSAIQNWIDEQLKYKQCLIVLIGEHTAKRPWVQYEIKKAEEMGKAIFGIYIHNLEDVNGYSKKGSNPFTEIYGYEKYKSYDPSHCDIKGLRAYDVISKNIQNWIEYAVLTKER